MMAPEAHDPCQSCPRRLDTQDTRRAYCEGCPRRLRRCPACDQFRPQVGWDWGFVRRHVLFAQGAWVCADCKARRPEGDLQPRVGFRLHMSDRVRVLLSSELELSAGRLQAHPKLGPVLASLARQVATGAQVDLDVEELDRTDRRWLLKTARDCTNRLNHPWFDQAEELVRKLSWAIPPLPEPAGQDERQPSPAEHAARMALERPA